MVTVDEIVAGQKLGSMMMKLLIIVCENAYRDDGTWYVDGLDKLWRERYPGDNTPTHGIRGLVEKGYLVESGTVKVKWAMREVKRYRVILASE